MRFEMMPLFLDDHQTAVALLMQGEPPRHSSSIGMVHHQVFQ